MIRRAIKFRAVLGKRLVGLTFAALLLVRS
jgi:hypothetical protein